MPVAIETLVVGRTYRFPLAATETDRDTGVVSALDLTGATVTLIFYKPDSTSAVCSATIDSASAGTAHYDTLKETPSQDADLDQAGNWSCRWLVEFSGGSPPLYLPALRIPFQVQA